MRRTKRFPVTLNVLAGAFRPSRLADASPIDAVGVIVVPAMKDLRGRRHVEDRSTPDSVSSDSPFRITHALLFLGIAGICSLVVKAESRSSAQIVTSFVLLDFSLLVALVSSYASVSAPISWRAYQIEIFETVLLWVGTAAIALGLFAPSGGATRIPSEPAVRIDFLFVAVRADTITSIGLVLLLVVFILLSLIGTLWWVFSELDSFPQHLPQNTKAARAFKVGEGIALASSSTLAIAIGLSLLLRRIAPSVDDSSIGVWLLGFAEHYLLGYGLIRAIAWVLVVAVAMQGVAVLLGKPYEVRSLDDLWIEPRRPAQAILRFVLGAPVLLVANVVLFAFHLVSLCVLAAQRFARRAISVGLYTLFAVVLPVALLVVGHQLVFHAFSEAFRPSVPIRVTSIGGWYAAAKLHVELIAGLLALAASAQFLHLYFYRNPVFQLRAIALAIQFWRGFPSLEVLYRFTIVGVVPVAIALVSFVPIGGAFDGLAQFYRLAVAVLIAAVLLSGRLFTRAEPDEGLA